MQHNNNKVPEQHPKLKMASLEIQEILKRYDIAGVLQLFLPGHTESVLALSPTFSCIEINDARQLRINPPIALMPDESDAKRKIVDTVNMLNHLRTHLTQQIMALAQSEQAVRMHFKIEPPKKPGTPGLPKNMFPN